MEGNVVGRIVNHAVSSLSCALSWSDCFIGVWLLGEWRWTVGGRAGQREHIVGISLIL